MAKILMVNLPYSGHTNPTLSLAKRLVERGHQVTYINAPEWKERIEATGAAFVAYLDYPAGLLLRLCVHSGTMQSVFRQRSSRQPLHLTLARYSKTSLKLLYFSEIGRAPGELSKKES